MEAESRGVNNQAMKGKGALAGIGMRMRNEKPMMKSDHIEDIEREEILNKMKDYKRGSQGHGNTRASPPIFSFMSFSLLIRREYWRRG